MTSPSTTINPTMTTTNSQTMTHRTPRLGEAAPLAAAVTAAVHGTRSSIAAFALQLDDNRTTFTPGQQIEGHVALSLVRPASIHLVRVRFMGSVTTHIDSQQPAQERSINSASQASSCLFKEIYNLVGTTSMESEIALEAGEHIFPFAFRVPPSMLPASFQGAYGEIQYEITAALVRMNGYKRIISTPITIPSTQDPNTPQLLEPVSTTAVCGVGRLWWKSGHIDISASIPRSGYLSEETIPLRIDMVNHSAHTLVLYDIAIKQRVMYKTNTETRGPHTERIHKINFSERIDPHTRRITRLVQFPIPPTTILSPYIFTPILNVSHSIGFKVLSCAPLSVPCKVHLPIYIAGFPCTVADERMQRRSIDTLPVYEGGDPIFEDNSGMRNGSSFSFGSVSEGGMSLDHAELGGNPLVLMRDRVSMAEPSRHTGAVLTSPLSQPTSNTSSYLFDDTVISSQDVPQRLRQRSISIRVRGMDNDDRLTRSSHDIDPRHFKRNRFWASRFASIFESLLPTPVSSYPSQMPLSPTNTR